MEKGLRLPSPGADLSPSLGAVAQRLSRISLPQELWGLSAIPFSPQEGYGNVFPFVPPSSARRGAAGDAAFPSQRCRRGWGEPSHAVASVWAQQSLYDHRQPHGDTWVLAGVTVSWSGVWGLLRGAERHRESISSVSRGPGPRSLEVRPVSSSPSSTQVNARCGVSQKPQVLQQTRPFLGGAWHHPELRASPGDSGHRETPSPASWARGSHSEGVKGCAQEHTEQQCRRRECVPGGVLPCSPKGVWPQGAPTGWA